MILIVSSNFNNISTILVNLSWRVSISFFGICSFTNIDTYVVCVMSFFFLYGVTTSGNTTSGSVPGFVPVSKAISSLPLPFFVSPVSGLPLDLWFFWPISIFIRAFFNPLISLLPFSLFYVCWVVIVLSGFILFVGVYLIGVLC